MKHEELGRKETCNHIKMEELRLCKEREKEKDSGPVAIDTKAPPGFCTCVNLLVCGEDVSESEQFTMLHINRGIPEANFFP